MPPSPEQLASMFDRAARRYDALNAVLSWGQDGSWRRAAASTIPRGSRVLDLCCGSGRSSVVASQKSGETVFGVDVSGELLALGRTYAAREGAPFRPIRADAFRLPFDDESFDAVTVAWGLRNLVPNDAALAEAYRVLRPGGHLLVLDSPAPSGWSAPLHRLYLRLVVPLVGRLSPDPAAYRYLASSIEAFGTAEEVARRIELARFEVESTVPFLLGAAVCWRANKRVETPRTGEPRFAPREESGLHFARTEREEP